MDAGEVETYLNLPSNNVIMNMEYPYPYFDYPARILKDP